MSARDEIARALHRADVEPRRFDPHWNVHEWDELTDEAREYWRRLAGALMPIVERAVERAVIDGANDQKIRQWSGQQTVGPDGVATIVARVMEGGQ